MSKTFIKYKQIVSEFKAYKSIVNYENYFNNLPNNIKHDLNFLTDYHYKDFKKNEMDEILTITLKIPSVKKINGLPISMNLYLVKDCQLTPFLEGLTNKIGINVCLYSKQHISDDSSDLLQNIYLLDCNINNEDNFKNYIYNILFYGHMIIKYFEYHPLLKFIYHKDDIPNLVNIRQTYIRVFGEENTCSVCMEQTITKTICGHYICQECFCLLDKKICPLCRKEINSTYRLLLNF